MHHTHFVLPPQLVFDTQNKNQVINQTGGTTIQGFVKHREGIGRIDMRGSQQEEQQQQQQQQQQDQRVRSLQPDDQQQLQPQQPQKCPRCESLNTKFCYYNNYSLSQPRYFCKTCRRYWTQGGTLRNVPVGGGCRKGKRPKRSSSVDQQQNQPPPNSAATTTAISITSSPSLRNQDTANMASPAIPLVPVGSSSYFPGGGFFSPLPGIQSFNQPINFAGDLGGSNLALLQGFNLPSFNPSQQQQQVFQVGTRDKIMHHLLPSVDNVIQPDSRPSTSHHQGWHHSLINSSTNSIATDPVYWSSGSNSNANHPTSSTVPSLNTSQWPDLPGYGPPPSSSSPSFP